MSPTPEAAVLTTCLACHQPFPDNQTVEAFPVGRRIAFDPHRGRLWAVCPSCARWTLAPFETRWEALDELERIARDDARLLAETDTIGLLAAGDIEIVRVGQAGLREESWWRYGREYSARRKGARRIARRGKIYDTLIIMLLSGIPFWGLSDGKHWIARARNRRFGKRLWEGRSRCPRCGFELDHIGFRESNDLRVRRDGHGQLALSFDCPRCWNDGPPTHFISGVAAEHVLRRGLAFTNFAGAEEPEVKEAMGLVESYPSTAVLIDRVAERELPLAHLSEKGALALEIALNSDVEERLLRMELGEIEARWREEEEIAAIADRLLT